MEKWWDSMLGLVGQDQKSVVERDMGDYNKEKGVAERSGWEWLGDRIAGRNQDEMNQLARDKHLSTLRDSKAGRSLIRAAENDLLGNRLSTDIHWSDDSLDLEARSAKINNILGAKEKAVGLGADRSAVKASDSLGDLHNLGVLGSENRQWGSRANQHALSRERIADKRLAQADARTHMLDKIAMGDRRDARLERAQDRRDTYSLRLQDLERLKGQDADRMLMWQQQRIDRAHARKQDLMLAIMQGIQAIPL